MSIYTCILTQSCTGYFMRIYSLLHLLTGDVKMMAMWASVNNEYAVLSTYVTDSSELPLLENNNDLGIYIYILIIDNMIYILKYMYI